LFSIRSFRCAFPYLVLCGCLAATEPTVPPTGPAAAGSNVDQPSGWLETLSDLPVVRWLISPVTAMQPLANLHFVQPPAACSVAALPEIQDPEALAFEKGTGPTSALDTNGLLPAMARALVRFQQLVNSVGGTFELKSAYRPASYQAHLQAVWFKWMLELRRNRELGCQALRAEVGEEFARHHLLETQKPVDSSDHTRGMAFDAAVTMPHIARLKRRRVSLDHLALLAGIKRPDIRRDPVHFKLAVARAPRRG
jgi:hypothetical protein